MGFYNIALIPLYNFFKRGLTPSAKFPIRRKTGSVLSKNMATTTATRVTKRITRRSSWRKGDSVAYAAGGRK